MRGAADTSATPLVRHHINSRNQQHKEEAPEQFNTRKKNYFRLTRLKLKYFAFSSIEKEHWKQFFGRKFKFLKRQVIFQAMFLENVARKNNKDQSNFLLLTA